MHDQAVKKGENAPVVMALIGQDDPHRGDSKGAVGVARHAAALLKGQYVYLDDALLAEQFKNAKNYKARLEAYFEENPSPDIVIGACTQAFFDAVKKPLLVSELRINEMYSESRVKRPMGLVSHDLSRDFLSAARNVFDDKAPELRGEVVGVLMGGMYPNMQAVARQLVRMASFKPETTFYLCPSKRTTDFGFNVLKREIEIEAERLECDIHIAGMHYNKQIEGYNPYHGLLDRADHLVVVGDSGSLISEALYTGKRIYIPDPPTYMCDLMHQGYITDLYDVGEQPFIQQKKPVLNVTADVARSIAEEYHIEHARLQR